jgi:hypothetical protein
VVVCPPLDDHRDVCEEGVTDAKKHPAPGSATSGSIVRTGRALICLSTTAVLPNGTPWSTWTKAGHRRSLRTRCIAAYATSGSGREQRPGHIRLREDQLGLELPRQRSEQPARISIGAVVLAPDPPGRNRRPLLPEGDITAANDVNPHNNWVQSNIAFAEYRRRHRFEWRSSRGIPWSGRSKCACSTPIRSRTAGPSRSRG